MCMPASSDMAKCLQFSVFSQPCGMGPSFVECWVRTIFRHAGVCGCSCGRVCVPEYHMHTFSIRFASLFSCLLPLLR